MKDELRIPKTLFSGCIHQFSSKNKQVASTAAEEMSIGPIPIEPSLVTEAIVEKSTWNGSGEGKYQGALKEELFAESKLDRIEGNEPQGLLLSPLRMKKAGLDVLATTLDAHPMEHRGLYKGPNVGTCVLLESDGREGPSPVCTISRAAESVSVPSFAVDGLDIGTNYYVNPT